MEHAQSKDQCFFHGQFIEIPGVVPSSFTVKMFVMNNSLFAKRLLKMHPFNIAITIKLDPITPEQFDLSCMIKYSGVVVSDIRSNGFAFGYVVQGSKKPSLKSLNSSNTHGVYISYLTGTLPKDGQLLVVDKIPAIDSQHQPHGVDLKTLFLGDETLPPAIIFWQARP